MQSSHLFSLFNDFRKYRPAVPELELLNSVRLSGVLKGDALMRAPWGVALPASVDTVALYLIEEGSCVVKTSDENFVMHRGDALLVSTPLAFSMGDALDTPCQSLFDFLEGVIQPSSSAEEQLKLLFQSPWPTPVPAQTTKIVTLRMYIDKSFPQALLSTLPRFSLLPDFYTNHRDFLEVLLHQIVTHGATGFLGQTIAVRLAESIFVTFLKDYLRTLPQSKSGVHGALRDPQLAKVLGALQNAPEQDWDIARMAAIASLSRSAFIERFTNMVGESPSHFLLGMRMAIAADQLVNTSKPIIQIALAAGYGSEASFSRAFHRWAGKTPGAYRSRK